MPYFGTCRIPRELFEEQEPSTTYTESCEVPRRLADIPQQRNMLPPTNPFTNRLPFVNIMSVQILSKEMIWKKVADR